MIAIVKEIKNDKNPKINSLSESELYYAMSKAINTANEIPIKKSIIAQLAILFITLYF